MKKILYVILMIICSINLTGCQLAEEDTQPADKNMCGVFVRFFDDDGSDDLDYDKKYYIDYDSTTGKYSIDGLEGEAIFLYKNGDTLETVSDDVFRNVKMDVLVNSKDDEDFYKTYQEEAPNSELKVDSEEYQLEATIYYTGKFKGTIQFDSIIKDGDKYYITLDGQGIYLDNLGSWSTSESAQYTEKDSGGNEITKKFSYKISIEPVDELKSIKIKEMDKNDTVINTKQIIHTKDDYEFKIGKNTAYIIVEETCIDSKSKKETIKRTVYDRDEISDQKDETIDHPCNYAGEGGIVIPKDLYIVK
ncbi:MAG: hypothetical protein MR593_04360 [Intestinibacter sp.]|uniref:hypothetical protein n=1 Tax=Intestinibacter sp. TaxID=1965304 RepID=UPI0025B8CA17|nr:hypothetical protein [Intestinibacter sp.]MCI6737337.1 hypothetical protein [Intestinibacter sp.]